MSLIETKKSPLVSLPFLKKRLRRITAIGLRNLTVNEFNFTVNFTLHRTDKTVAFYTSSHVENQRSPEWSYLKFPPGVQCLQDFVMRIWISSTTASRLILEYDVHLDDSLVPDEQKDGTHRSNNSLWVEMFGYRFTDSESILAEPITVPAFFEKRPPTTSKRFHMAKSYNKLSILRMINVIHAIHSERRSAVACLEQLQTFSKVNQDYFVKIKECESHKLRLEYLKQCRQTQIDLYEQRFNANQQRQQLLDKRKNQLIIDLNELQSHREDLNTTQNYLNKARNVLCELTQLSVYRQKEIINEISRYVYPIVSDKKHEFTIANIKLPQADDKIYQAPSSRDRDNEIAAAIGFCCHFVLIISQFIQLPLRFPIDFHGASSLKIYDNTLQNSEFPLYPTSDLSAFRYAFFLLNRDIGQIMHHCRVGGRNTDYRKTLENLKEIIDQYFTPSKNNSLQLYASNPQLVQSMTSASNVTASHLSIPRVKQRDRPIACSFSSSRSSISSLMGSGDFVNDEDEDDDRESFPPPRLAMQLSHQPARQQ